MKCGVAFLEIFAILKAMKTLNLTTIVWQEGKYFVARCLENNVSSFGQTRAEAMKNYQEALELYFEDEPRMPSPSLVKNPELVKTTLAHA